MARAKKNNNAARNKSVAVADRIRCNRRQARKYYFPCEAVTSAPRTRSVDTESKHGAYETVNEFADYGVDILNTLKEGELRHRVKPTYMQHQREISYEVRARLIDWLIAIGDEYDLASETIHLTVSIVDRFLCTMSATLTKFQLVGIAALYIAVKFEETTPLAADELLELTDVNEGFTLDHILRMEQVILYVLKFNLCVPTASAFLGVFCLGDNSSDEIKYLAQYIAELSLMDGEQYLSYLPSEIAAASLAVARLIKRQPIWTEKLENLSGYPEQKLFSLVAMLSKSHAASSEQRAGSLYMKYSHCNFVSDGQNPVIDFIEEISKV